MGNWTEMTHLRPKRSRSPSPGRLLPVHSLGFDEEYEDLTSTSWQQSSSSFSGSTVTQLPRIVCSKYDVIGDPKSRKIKFKPKAKLWRMPKITRENSILVAESNDPLFDRRTLYGTKHRQRYERIVRDNSTILPKLAESEGGFRDAMTEKERKYVIHDYQMTGPFRRFERDEVHVPTVYPHYFGSRRNKDLYVRHKFTEEYRKRNSRFPTCAKCFDEENLSTHFCDVLGKRFCRHCEEYSNRLFSWNYERKKLFPLQYIYDEYG